MNHWSKWLDYWLKKLKPSIPTYVKDCEQVLSKTSNLDLPLSSLLFVRDTNSMYKNIDTAHAILVITWWLLA